VYIRGKIGFRINQAPVIRNYANCPDNSSSTFPVANRIKQPSQFGGHPSGEALRKMVNGYISG
jgi:hypothetical protein